MYDSPIYICGHNGLVGSAIARRLRADGAKHLLLRTRKQLDLRRQADVERFFAEHRPQYVFLAAAKVGGIEANRSHPAQFLRDNLQIQTNIIDAAQRFGTRKLLFLGSSCIYPRLAPLANHWNERMGIATRYPLEHAAFLELCHQAGQRRPTPLLLQYGAGDYNCLHQDLYGELAFPLQTAILLSAPGEDGSFASC